MPPAELGRIKEGHRSAAFDLLIDGLMEGVGVPAWLSSDHFGEFQGLPVRLLHCYESSGCPNVGVFLELGAEKRFKLRNYGQKSEDALRRIISDLVVRKGDPIPTVQQSSERAASIKGPPHEPSFDILKAHDKPWKLISPAMWKSWTSRLESIASRRVNDVATVLGLWWPENLRGATLGEFLSIPLDQLPGLPRMGRVKMKTVFLTVAYSANHEEQQELDNIENILSLPALQNLDERERFILEKRLLMPERRQMTLEAVSLEQGVTRERIRQVEKMILNRLRESECGTRIGRLLEAAKGDIFQRLSIGELYLTADQLVTKEHEFGGPHLLAIYLEGRTLRAWLDVRFVKVQKCWFCGTAEEWATIERRLNNWRPEQFPLPEAVVAGSSNVTVREARAYFGCSGRAVPFEGYLLPTGNIMERRSARLHAFVAAEDWPGRDPALAAEAFARTTSDREAINHARHGYRAIMSTPSLFLASPGAVVPIHQASPWRPNRIELIGEVEETAAIPTAEAAIAGVILKNGPSSLNSTIESCEKDRRVTVTGGSVGVIITQSPRFVRLAPGLYDIREFATDPRRIAQARALLLNEKDVRRYCFAKHSGEELTSMFPLWDWEQEMRWALWGKAELASDTWGSLMAIASPEKWPVGSPIERTEWSKWKREARWRYKVSWHDDLPSDVPSVRDVFLVAHCARLTGSITWVRANFLLGATQINERVGLSAVVLGIILRLIAPTGRTRWLAQDSHPEFDREWIAYENLLIADPEVSWKNLAFQNCFTRASLLAASGELGWVEANEVSVLRSIATSGRSTSVSTAALDAVEESDDSDDIRI